MTSLLPPNATPLEKTLAAQEAKLDQMPVPIRQLWNPWTCPAHLLPYLAETLSVDYWQDDWPDSTKRQMIADSKYIHEHKGTPAAVTKMVSLLGYRCDLLEWFDQKPQGQPGTFDIRIGITDRAYTPEIDATLLGIINATKPKSRHIATLTVGVETHGSQSVAVCAYVGCVTTIYPQVIEPQQTQAAPIQMVGSVQVIDTLEIKP